MNQLIDFCRYDEHSFCPIIAKELKVELRSNIWSRNQLETTCRSSASSFSVSVASPVISPILLPRLRTVGCASSPSHLVFISSEYFQISQSEFLSEESSVRGFLSEESSVRNGFLTRFCSSSSLRWHSRPLSPLPSPETAAWRVFRNSRRGAML